MALSAVSSEAYAVGLMVGKAALPIAVDLITDIVLVRLVKILPLRSWGISAFPACTAVYLTSGVPKWDASGVITCCLYVFYKAIRLIFQSKVGVRTKPSIEDLKALHDELMAKVTITYNGPNTKISDIENFAVSKTDEVLKLWKDSRTVKIAEKLLGEAAAEMYDLCDDLESAVARESDLVRNKKMAELLTTRKGPNDYFSRFWEWGSFSLFDIYRDIRALRVNVYVPSTGQIVHCRIIAICHRTGKRVDDKVVQPFSEWGSRESQWRREYNRALGRFQMIIKNMDKSLESSKAFEAWAAKDVNCEVNRDDFDGVVFKLFPCKKPA